MIFRKESHPHRHPTHGDHHYRLQRLSERPRSWLSAYDHMVPDTKDSYMPQTCIQRSVQMKAFAEQIESEHKSTSQNKESDMK